MGSKRKRPESKLIFISHNRRDKELAREIALFLTSENINVWFDEWEISAGDSIIDQINKGLEGCTHFIIVWSRHAKKSNWVTSELKSAMTKAIKLGNPIIIPITIDKTPLPPLLSHIKYLRYNGGTEKDRWNIIRAITGSKPSSNYIKSIVKKYNELIYESNPKDPFGIKACPNCGSVNLEGSSFTDYRHDEVYFTLKCKECGWSTWSQ